MQWKYERTHSLFALFAVFALFAMLSAPSPYTAPTGDINGDGAVDALDIQCTVLVYEALELAGAVEQDLCQNDDSCPGNSYCRVGFGPGKQCLPACLSEDVDMGIAQAVLCMDEGADNPLCKGKTAKKNADLNCDGLLGNEDFVFMVAVIFDKLGLPTSPDFDDDGKLNGCLHCKHETVVRRQSLLVRRELRAQSQHSGHGYRPLSLHRHESTVLANEELLDLVKDRSCEVNRARMPGRLQPAGSVHRIAPQVVCELLLS